jgi:hypothetical protein
LALCQLRFEFRPLVLEEGRARRLALELDVERALGGRVFLVGPQGLFRRQGDFGARLRELDAQVGRCGARLCQLVCQCLLKE